MSLFQEFPVARILIELEADNLLPAILFRTARRTCDADLQAVTKIRRVSLSEAQQEVITKKVSEFTSRYGIEKSVIETHPHYHALITTGVGAHHAGQLLMWRLLLEELMSEGALRMLIATGTVAAGVDFPARTVVISAHSKRGSEGFNVLTASEFQQMSGRAGRRGRDEVGICLVAPSRYSDARVIHEVASKQPEPLKSSYYAAPATVLNLLKHRNVDDLRYTVERSLAAFHDRKEAEKVRQEAAVMEQEIPQDLVGEAKKKATKRVGRLLRKAEELAAQQSTLLEVSLTGLRALGYVEGGSLTEKGLWAAELCTNLVLELSEAIDAGIFTDASPFELAGLVASIAGDPHRPYFSLKRNDIAKSQFAAMEQVLVKIRAAYKNPFTAEVKVLPDAAVTVITWMEATNWDEFSSLLRLQGLADGDISRLASQTADHLNQIMRLKKTHPDLAIAAEEARMKLLRPPLSESFIIAA